MPRFHALPTLIVPFALFLAAIVFSICLRQISTSLADGIILAAPFGLGWVAPLLWGRRAILPILAGSVLVPLLTVGSPAIIASALAITALELGLGWYYSRQRSFPDGLNRLRDLLSLAVACVVAGLGRGLLVFTMALLVGLDKPRGLGFAACGLSAFANLSAAAILLGFAGRWRIPWTSLRVAELTAILAVLSGLTGLLFALGGSNRIPNFFPLAVALMGLQTWLALRFHIRGVGLHRALWLLLCGAFLLRGADVTTVIPLVDDPIYCGAYSLILALLLFIELAIAATASGRMIEAETNAALTAELRARNAELEKLSSAEQGQRAFLDSVLNQMPAGVMIVGMDGSILWRNQRHRTLWNDTTPQGVGLNDLKRSRISATKEHSVPFESWPIVKAISAGIVTEGFEARILSAEGIEIDVSVSAAPVHDAGGSLLGAVSILHDMSERKAALRSLRDKEERLRFALASARMIAYEWNVQTQCIQCSESLSHWIGLGSESICTLAELLKVVHPNDVAGLRVAVGKLIHAGNECECEFRIPSASGMLWIQCRGRRLVDEEGKSTDRVAGIFIDVSDRRRSEERLRMLESAVVHARDAVVILESESNLQPGRSVLYANDAFCQITGYSQDELIGRSLHLLRGPDSDPATLERLRDALDSGDSFKGELLNYRRDGTRFWVEISVVPVPDASGSRAHWVMIQRDISDRKHAERILQRSEAMLADAQRIAHIGSWEYLPATGECQWSAEKFRIFGYEPNAVAASVELYLAAVHPDDREKVDRVGIDAGRLTYPYRIDFRVVRPSGDIRFITEDYYADFDAAGNPVRFWGVTQDDTEKRLSQEQLFQSQKMELIGQMAGGIAHDFNNLLTGIIGNLHLAKMPEHDPNRLHVGTALRAAYRAADLTKKLLGFARKNQLILNPTRVDEIVAEVVGIIGRTFDPRVRVVAEIAAEHVVSADATLISQVLLNLALNARDAMPQGGRLDIRSDFATVEKSGELHHDARPGEYVRLTVEDSGQGMAPEVLARVFEPFFTTKPIGQGTGLGLAMVHGIMTQHRGWVEVQSAVGRGTRFNLYLPRSDGEVPSEKFDARTCHDLAETEPRPVNTTQRRTVLIVDDESMIRNVGRAALESAGFAVLEAEDGEAAIALFRSCPSAIDLVVLDLTMPNMSGQDTFHSLLKIDPAVRILFSSGYSADDLSGTEGALGLLPKPYRPQLLVDLVRRALPSPQDGADGGSNGLNQTPAPNSYAVGELDFATNR